MTNQHDRTNAVIVSDRGALLMNGRAHDSVFLANDSEQFHYSTRTKIEPLNG